MSEENKQRLEEYQKNYCKAKTQHKKNLSFFFTWYKNGTRSLNFW